jgi:hypothetical protein
MNAPLRTVALVAALTMTLPAPSADAVYDGVPVLGGDTLLNQVMSLGRWVDPNQGGGMGFWPGDKEMVGTAMVIAHERIEARCMLTAKHLTTWDTHGDPEYHRVVIGSDVRRLKPAHRDQLVAETEVARGGKAGPLGIDPYRDLRVLWLENRKDDGADKRIRLRDYAAQPIGPLPLPEGHQDKAYTMSGYGMSGDAGVDTQNAIHRAGDGRVTKVEFRADIHGGGARMQVRPGLKSRRTECMGDSGTAVMLGDRTVFSAMTTGGQLKGQKVCDPDKKFDWLDPNGGDTLSGNPPSLAAEISLYSALNDRGEISGDPETFTTLDWNHLGNWQQVEYLVSKVCTKEVFFQVQGSGSIDGELTGKPLRAYDTERLNHSIACVGENPDIQTVSTGDCLEAVHQPEGLTVEATPAEGWAFHRWSDGPEVMTDGGHVAPSLCPCEGKPVTGKPATCSIDFDDIGQYDAHSSIDVSMCMAEFVRVDAEGEGSGPTSPMF